MDPLAEKYYSISPYVYVANNPMRYIDPTGMWIDDYFSENGDYLGTDNSESQKVRIMNQTAWDTNKSNDGTIVSQKGQVNSTLLSKSGVSDKVFFNVYQHYNPTDLKLSITNSSTGLMQFTVESHNNEILGKKIEVDRRNIFAEGTMDNVAEIKSSFIHEEKHYNDLKEFGVGKYMEMSQKTNISGRQVVDNRAISTQISHSTWEQTSPSYQSGIRDYANRLHIIVPGLNANVIQPRVDITKIKIKSIIFFVIFFIGCVPFIDAQVQMNVTQLVISQVKRGDSFQKTVKIGNETKIVHISRENAEDTPHLDAIVEIRNISDSLIILFPYSSKLEIIFRLDGGYMIETGTKLEMITRDINNFSNLLLKILPTLKYQYTDNSGVRIIQNEIYDVKLK